MDSVAEFKTIIHAEKKGKKNYLARFHSYEYHHLGDYAKVSHSYENNHRKNEK